MLDVLHRSLATWLAPVLCFTAEEAWCARFGDEDSVHLQLFPALPQAWRDDALAAKWARIRDIRRSVTAYLEVKRKDGLIGSSLQAVVKLPLHADEASLLTPKEWAEVAIVSRLEIYDDAALIVPRPSGASPEEQSDLRPVAIAVADGAKCARCWRVLPEVGTQPNHPTLCLRCADAVESGLVCRAAAA